MDPSETPCEFLTCVLLPLGLLAFLCILIYLGIRNGKDSLIIIPGLVLIFVGLPVVFVAPGFLGFFLDRTTLYTCWYIVMAAVWLFLAYFGLRRWDESRSRILLLFAIIWTFPTAYPLRAHWNWPAAKAYFLVFGVSAAGYILVGMIVKAIENTERLKGDIEMEDHERLRARGEPPREE
ncbi:MAG: hypothetical protein JW941_07240 [Candidatus Coatesbacteria bacterium]|nr:hypothetical protein [Candidatus Coatesbacteria bacterium]